LNCALSVREPVGNERRKTNKYSTNF